MSNEIAEIEFVDSSFGIHEFNTSFFTSDIRFEVLKMKESTMIWIGDAQNSKFSDLSFSIRTASSCDPTTTKILGIASPNSISDIMAEKLSRKLKKPVYVSFNCDISNSSLLEKIQERLVEEIDLHSEFF